MRVSIVVAYDRERAIGVDGGLPWHLPDDLKRFKALSLGTPMLMGRRTAVSLGRALRGRLILVLSRSGRVPFEGMEAVPSIEAALERVRDDGGEELAVIGGGGVFEATLPIATWLHLTLVDTTVARADTWFPPFPADEWSEVARTHHAADAKHPYAFDFVDMVRARPART
jgi:dihydrofolate reductase